MNWQRPWTSGWRVGRWIAALSCLAIAGPSQQVRADDWAQFRGSNATGISSDTTPLPTEFSFESNVRWQAALGDGVACPVVAGGRVFCTAMTGPERFAVIALDASSGTEIWRQEMETGPLPAITAPNSHASSTPATDGRRVFVYFSTIGLMAFDAADGHEVWRRPLPAPAYLLDWGAAGSPIVYQDLVIFNQDDDLDSYLLALDTATGEERWRTPRPEMLAGYAVPVICQSGGQTDIVVAGSGKLKGYDPSTGQERWTCNTLLRTIMSSPVVHDGVVYVSVQSYGDTDRLLKSALLEWKDTNQDGRLTKEEVPQEFWRKFDAGNANGDEFLEGEEIDRAFQSPDNMVGGGRIIQAVRGGGQGDVTGTHLLWNLNNRAPSNISSPLVVGGRLHVVKRGGLSSCFDAATGETLWETKRVDNLGDYFASPVAGDGKIYMAGENGFVVVLADRPELEVLARNDMGESCVATPAIAGGALFIRTREKLFCVGQ